MPTKDRLITVGYGISIYWQKKQKEKETFLKRVVLMRKNPDRCFSFEVQQWLDRINLQPGFTSPFRDMIEQLPRKVKTINKGQQQVQNGSNRYHYNPINQIKKKAYEVKNTIHVNLIYRLSVRTIRFAEFAGKGSILVR